MDQKVLMTQKWLNNTYSDIAGYISCVEDGATGNGTVTSLIAALQIELNIDYITGEFGPMTAEACPTLVTGATGNIVNILQGALWCKGFSSDDLTGKFENSTLSGVNLFKSAAGLGADGTVDAKTFKGILSTDAVVLIDGGDSKIRQIQVALNSKYSDYFWKDLNICPCDGYYGRNTCNALLYAFQKEVGIDEPNGVFGPGTAQGANDHNVALGSQQTDLVYLLQYMLYVNGFDTGNFDGVFDSAVESAVMDFQDLMALDSDGWVGLSTWAALLVSKGNTDRACNAVDCTDRISSAIAINLKNSGINYIGRYLNGYWGMSLGEFKNIIDAGLKYIPIYQRSGRDLDGFAHDNTEVEYFYYGRGQTDAIHAMEKANHFGLPHGATIYFAVDFDVYDYEVESNIIPYFQGINSRINNYNVGIYAPRYACQKIYEEGLALHSYVSDMSVGYSGNIGQRIPDNWAFDQFATTSMGSGNTYIDVDKVMASGLDTGVANYSLVDFNTNYCQDIVDALVPVNLGFDWQFNVPVSKAIGPQNELTLLVGVEGAVNPLFDRSVVGVNHTISLSVNDGQFSGNAYSSAVDLYASLSDEIKASIGNSNTLEPAISVANTIQNGTITVSFLMNNGYLNIDIMVETNSNTFIELLYEFHPGDGASSNDLEKIASSELNTAIGLVMLFILVGAAIFGVLSGIGAVIGGLAALIFAVFG